MASITTAFEPATVAQIIQPQPASFLALNPELPQAAPAVELKLPALPTERENAELSMMPPTIDPDVRLDVASYTARANLPAGVVATVILLLDVGRDGTVTAAKVVRSSATEEANEAAVDYAKATRWMPGRIDGEPRAMQASLTVILGERG
jgi:TonB family protein